MLTGITIYLVEDDEAVRDSLSAILRTWGANVQSFASVAEITAASLDESYACLVVDIRLPDGDGFDLLHQLRQRQVNHPAIFVTGERTMDLTQATARAGAVALVEKPVDGEAIALLIKEVLNRRFTD